MRILIILLSQLWITGISAQSLTGIWRGSFSSGQSSVLQRLYGNAMVNPYKYEVQIQDVSGQLKGVTYSYQDTSFYGKASFSGTFSSATKKVLVQEKKMLELKMSAGSGACIMTCYLSYVKMGNEEFLEGPFTSMNVRDSSDCGRGSVRLRKVPFSDFKKEPFLSTPRKDLDSPPDPRDRAAATPKKSTPSSDKPVKKPVAPPTVKQEKTVEPAKPVQVDPPRDAPVTKAPPVAEIKPPATTAGRENTLISTIEVETGEITVKLYDNGAIDNDSISVYQDGIRILNNQRLSAQPITLTLKQKAGGPATTDLVMVAENMGEVPPNTSLMVVEAGDVRKEVRITSTWEKNAMVRFRWKKNN